MEIGWWVEIVTHHNRFLTLEWVFDTEPVSQSLFFFSGRIIMRLTIVLDSCFLHIICFLLCFFSVIIFLFFATHCMWFLRLMLLCFFFGEKMQSNTPDGYGTYVSCSHLRFVSNYRVSGRSTRYKLWSEMLMNADKCFSKKKREANQPNIS